MGKSIEVGARLQGYRVDRKEPLENLQGTFYQLTHTGTRARHIHVEGRAGAHDLEQTTRRKVSAS